MRYSKPAARSTGAEVDSSSVITYLKVRNLAIVEEFSIEPGAGLNVLTGETGAGKSLLIDSLEFLRGARGSTEMIRSGSEKMSAEAVFQLPAMIAERLDAIGGHGPLLDATRATYHVWKTTADQLRALTDAQNDRTLRLDLLKYQINEIAAAKLDPAEEENLRAERTMLANARELAEASS